MRLTYFDDAGLFNHQQEPFIVIGGCLVDGDRQLNALEGEFQRLVNLHIPREDQTNFVFHSMELWSGGKYFDRERWPLQVRQIILSDLAAIPRKLKIPLTFGCFSRDEAEDSPAYANRNRRDLELSQYAVAYARFAASVEQAMRTLWPSENAILIGEDNAAIRSMTKAVHNLYRDPEFCRTPTPPPPFFPFQRIKEGVHFSPKQESIPLQLADLTTFIVKKRLMRDPKAESLYSQIEDSLLVLPIN